MRSGRAERAFAAAGLARVLPEPAPWIEEALAHGASVLVSPELARRIPDVRPRETASLYCLDESGAVAPCGPAASRFDAPATNLRRHLDGDSSPYTGERNQR